MKILKNMLLLFTFSLSCTLHAQIAYYPFGGDADDVVNGYNGTVNGATLAPDRDGNPNSAYLLDGVDDYIEVVNSNAFNFGTNEFAVSLWIKPLNPTQNFQMIFQKGNSGGTIPQYWLRLNDLAGNSTLRALWGDGFPPATIIDYNNSGTLFDGEWHHVLFQRTNERNELYIDCILVGSNSNINQNISSSGSLFIGAQHPNPPNSTNPYNFYNGLIDDVAFYDKAFDFNVCTLDDLCVDISTETVALIDDQDKFMDGVGFANNPSVVLTDPSTPANAVLSNISLDLYFRLLGSSCESDIALQITDPAGNTQSLTAFTTCNGGSGLFFVNVPVPSAATTGGLDDWIIEFNDTNDQNTGDEYSLRFARINYTATATTTADSPDPVTEVVSDYDDQDIFIDAGIFANNPSYTFTDPGTPADAILTDIDLELYFRLLGSCCESDITLQITDPTGNTQPLTAFTTCNGGSGLYYVNIPVPNGSTTASVADWVVEFDAASDKNSGDEYSVRFGRLTYTANYCDELGQNITEVISNSTNENESFKRQSQLTDQPIKLYPIPTTNRLNVDYYTDNENPSHIEIISNDGKILVSQQVTGQKGMNNVELDVASLAAGHYYVRIYGASDAPQIQSFIKINP